MLRVGVAREMGERGNGYLAIWGWEKCTKIGQKRPVLFWKTSCKNKILLF